MDEYDIDPDLAFERHLESDPTTAWEEEQDMLRTLDTDPIWRNC